MYNDFFLHLIIMATADRLISIKPFFKIYYYNQKNGYKTCVPKLPIHNAVLSILSIALLKYINIIMFSIL